MTTELVTNNAAAALGVPLAIDLAEKMNLASPHPLAPWKNRASRRGRCVSRPDWFGLEWLVGLTGKVLVKCSCRGDVVLVGLRVYQYLLT